MISNPATQEAAQKLLDQVPQILPGVPNSAWIPIALGQIRTVGALASGMGFAWGQWVSGDGFTMWFWGVSALVLLVWSGWNKVYAEIAKYRLAAASAQASAKATADSTPADVNPVSVAVTPAGVKVLSPAFAIIITALALSACSQLTYAVDRFEARAPAVVANACVAFNRAEASPLVRTALAVGSTAATAASGVPVGAIVASLRSSGARFCADGPPTGDATSSDERAAWLAGVTARMIEVAMVRGR